MIKKILFCMATCLLVACSSPPPSVTIGVKSVDGDFILIQGVAVFDPVHLAIKPNQDVLIVDDRIKSVRPSQGLSAPGNAYIIDGTGRTLVPGLIDMHGHLTTTTGPSWKFSLPAPNTNLLAYAYAGVTTIFDPSDSSDDAYSRREQVADGKLYGPRIFTTGRIITHPDGHPRALVQELAPWWIRWYIKPRVGSGVSTPEEAIAEVNERADAGADAIKIVIDMIPLEAPTLANDIANTIVKQASKRGIRTVAHIGTTTDAIAAAEVGVSLWVHGVYKEKIPDDKIKQLVDYNIPMVTTSEVFDRYGRAADGPIRATKLEQEIVPKVILDSFSPIPEDFDPGSLRSWADLMATTSEIRLDNVARLHQAGMTILAGSDVQSGVFPGASLHRELGNLVQAGLTPAEAIRAATLLPAQYLSNSDQPDYGVIAAGKRADLLLVKGDPTQDISALSDIEQVFLNGKILDRKAVEN